MEEDYVKHEVAVLNEYFQMEKIKRIKLYIKRYLEHISQSHIIWTIIFCRQYLDSYILQKTYYKNWG